MHLLPCPECEASIPVSPSQAGDQATCPTCQASVPIPKLGQLRQLPMEEGADTAADVGGARELESSVWSRAGFLVLGLVAVASLLIAGFCTIRWYLVEVAATSEAHVELLREQYQTLTAAQLIREYEDIEKNGLDLPAPYNYKTAALEKARWGWNASIAAVLGLLATFGAFAVGSSTRRKQT